jgi:hypothetical protein
MGIATMLKIRNPVHRIASPKAARYTNPSVAFISPPCSCRLRHVSAVETVSDELDKSTILETDHETA